MMEDHGLDVTGLDTPEAAKLQLARLQSEATAPVCASPEDLAREELDAQTTEWVERETLRYRQDGWEPRGPREAEILATWQRNRPRLWARLVKAGLAEKMAFVLDRKRYQAKVRYIKAGMPPTDAEEQATKEWLMLDEEPKNWSRWPGTSAGVPPTRNRSWVLGAVKPETGKRPGTLGTKAVRQPRGAAANRQPVNQAALMWLRRAKADVCPWGA